MDTENINKEKKKWDSPNLVLLDFKLTKGGDPDDWGEDEFADIDPSNPV